MSIKASAKARVAALIVAALAFVCLAPAALAADPGAIDQARAKLLVAQDNYSTAVNERDLGAIDFFERWGSPEAAQALRCSSLPNGSDKPLYSYTDTRDFEDAAYYSNVARASSYILECNRIRRHLGLPRLDVSLLLMAYAEADANYSAVALDHAKVFDVEENLIWAYKVDPIIQCYYTEKGIYDRQHGNPKDVGYTNPLREDACIAAYEDGYDGNAGEDTSHYENLINPDYTVTGFAICTRGYPNSPRTFCQTFGSNSIHADFDAYEYDEIILNYEYCRDHAIEDSTKKLAQAEAALQEACEAQCDSVTVTYDGKYHRPELTTCELPDSVGIGYASSGRKSVGETKVEAYLFDIETNRHLLTFENTVTVNPKGATIKTPYKGKTYVTARWYKQSGKMSTSRIGGYEVQIAKDRDFTVGEKSYTVSGYSKVSKKITKLKRHTTYYVKVRTYKTVSGTKYYSPWSKVKAVKTK